MKKFSYNLTGLQRIQSYEIDQLTNDLALLRDAENKKNAQISSIENSINEYREYCQKCLSVRSMFWIENRELTQKYIDQLRSDMDSHILEKNNLIKKISQLTNAVILAQTDRRIIDKHHKRALENYRKLENQYNFQLADEFVMRKKRTFTLRASA